MFRTVVRYRRNNIERLQVINRSILSDAPLNLRFLHVSWKTQIIQKGEFFSPGFIFLIKDFT